MRFQGRWQPKGVGGDAGTDFAEIRRVPMWRGAVPGEAAGTGSLRDLQLPWPDLSEARCRRIRRRRKIYHNTFRFTRGEPKIYESAHVAERESRANRGQSADFSAPSIQTGPTALAGVPTIRRIFRQNMIQIWKISFDGSASTITFRACAPRTSSRQDVFQTGVLS